MQDLKIEYRDGKLVELSIDGVSFKTVTAITFSHTVGETLPTVSLTFPLGIGERLVPDNLPRENLRIIEK
ncbi:MULTISPECIES: serine acetyltransferase [Enterobacter cloacae complex]|uniref:serine acetyltransferase n=1 Tax=Enterobacter cloacae complex TaxID=354276 RepID=UPI001C6FFEE1|nr:MULTISPECIES: serine acetyltransferase [Enterobacter cloacae complex]MBW9419927.1 serine acetyltransferase [Enterobacter roggenkampii]MDR9880462.1 serine acetyltransferase [Enterobacter hormaechei subsp. steigerwaltii]